MILTTLLGRSLVRQVSLRKFKNELNVCKFIVKDKQHLDFQELLRDNKIDAQTERSANTKVK